MYLVIFVLRGGEDGVLPLHLRHGHQQHQVRVRRRHRHVDQEEPPGVRTLTRLIL